MKLWKRIRDAFGGSYAPALRNKPGGMAWINTNVDSGCGEGVLMNRVVRTLRISHGDFWLIDPPQSFTTTCNTAFTNGSYAKAGTTVLAVAVRDNSLTPIPGDLASDEEVRDLFAPSVTKEVA